MASKDAKGRNSKAEALVSPKKIIETKHQLQLLKEPRKEGMEGGRGGIEFLREKHNVH